MSNEILWRNNLSDARQEAERQNKPIFIDWADLPSCVGCVSLENNTYPAKDVIDFVSENFVPVQLNQRQNLEFFKQSKVIWTPTVTVCDAQGAEQMRWIGYLPPEEFLPKTKFALAWLAMVNQDYVSAAIGLKEIASSHKDSVTAPEALYWLGVADWKASKDFADLSNAWTSLMEIYPNSEAAQKASCL
jgi:hypothetical protein